jgi:hypothetical protein
MADQFQLPPGATAVTPDASQDAGSSTTTQQFALPPGATPVQQTSDTPEPHTTSFLDKVGDFTKGIGESMTADMGETIQALPWIGKKIISPEAMTAERAYFAPGTAAEKYGQTTGHIAEPILEFVMGDEALKGLALADKIGLAGKIVKIAQDSPYIGKILQHGVNAARMGTVGTAEALAKGATPAEAVKIGVATGVGGEALSTATEAAAPYVSKLFNPESVAGSEEAATEFNSPSKPNLYQQVTQGEKVAQAPAQEAVRTAVKSGGNEVGLTTVQPESLRTIAEEPINAVRGLKKNVYGQVDQAAGTDLKTLHGKLDAINDKIDLEASGSPEEARLEAQRTSQMQTIEDAKQAARGKGVDVDKLLDKGDALHTKEMALREFQKNYLKNPNIIEGNSAMGTPETANVDGGIKVLQKMQDNTKWGAPRLEQALGKEGANQLLKDMYAAQRLGVKAVDAQKLMDRIIKGLKITGYVSAVGGGAYEMLK